MLPMVVRFRDQDFASLNKLLAATLASLTLSLKFIKQCRKPAARRRATKDGESQTLSTRTLKGTLVGTFHETLQALQQPVETL